MPTAHAQTHAHIPTPRQHQAPPPQNVEHPGPSPSSSSPTSYPTAARAAAAPGGPPPPSSDLFRDIAETIHATFPSAQVAARHGVAPARVAELISGLVIRPLLLRCAGRPPPATG
ncbi:uncharacterized protein THITE_2122702 [Thermothielavioides terrestris NRRL 8126]|uniref:Uncharacterized protein n=1 Tax=Thermothielavioides terrestris (strain ATCC 38088 / NRRL 8126) TaxID=578455 RepID=G2RDY9_THETT|nr:uncharacterized protein THITE_2122702 [Thermothielavioides terrestris NRRL 8126]AEO70872.1 hypothetical protein THITE_2122702 [Thermothielavioides terrestris NRRL 8126]